MTHPKFNISKCKLLIFIAVCVFSVQTVFAQSRTDTINLIKKSLESVYATGTSMVSVDDARANAMELLDLEIDSWVKGSVSKDSSIDLSNIMSRVSEIVTYRGKLVRSFLFVDKSDLLLSFANKNGYVDDVYIDTLISVDRGGDYLDTFQVDQVSPLLEQEYIPSSCEIEMLKVDDLDAINIYIALGVRSGMVLGYGKYETGMKLYGKTYFFLIDKVGDVVAILRAFSGNMVDLKSGKNVSMDKYGRCGVIWFQIDED